MSTRRSTRHSSAEPIPLGTGNLAIVTPSRRGPHKSTGLGPAPVGQIPIPARPNTSYGGSHIPTGPAAIAKSDAAAGLKKMLAGVSKGRQEESETDPETDQDATQTPVPQGKFDVLT